MSVLAPCPACARHVRIDDGRCPFCDSPTSGARPMPARRVSRRELTRTAIVAGAAFLLAACGSEPERREELDDDDATGGGESGPTDFSSGRDTGEGRDTRVGADDDAERRRIDEEQRRLAAEEEQRRLAEEEQRRQQEQLDPYDDRDWRQRRQLPACVSEGTCAAPPYGTPPARDWLV